MSIQLDQPAVKPTLEGSYNPINLMANFNRPSIINNGIHAGSIDFSKPYITGYDGVGINSTALYGIRQGEPKFLVTAKGIYNNPAWGDCIPGEFRVGDNVKESDGFLTGDSWIWYKPGQGLMFCGPIKRVNAVSSELIQSIEFESPTEFIFDLDSEFPHTGDSYETNMSWVNRRAEFPNADIFYKATTLASQSMLTPTQFFGREGTSGVRGSVRLRVHDGFVGTLNFEVRFYDYKNVAATGDPEDFQFIDVTSEPIIQYFSISDDSDSDYYFNDYNYILKIDYMMRLNKLQPESVLETNLSSHYRISIYTTPLIEDVEQLSYRIIDTDPSEGIYPSIPADYGSLSIYSWEAYKVQQYGLNTEDIPEILKPDETFSGVLYDAFGIRAYWYDSENDTQHKTFELRAETGDAFFRGSILVNGYVHAGPYYEWVQRPDLGLDQYLAIAGTGMNKWGVYGIQQESIDVGEPELLPGEGHYKFLLAANSFVSSGNELGRWGDGITAGEMRIGTHVYRYNGHGSPGDTDYAPPMLLKGAPADPINPANEADAYMWFYPGDNEAGDGAFLRIKTPYSNIADPDLGWPTPGATENRTYFVDECPKDGQQIPGEPAGELYHLAQGDIWVDTNDYNTTYIYNPDLDDPADPDDCAGWVRTTKPNLGVSTRVVFTCAPDATEPTRPQGSLNDPNGNGTDSPWANSVDTCAETIWMCIGTSPYPDQVPPDAATVWGLPTKVNADAVFVVYQCSEAGTLNPPTGSYNSVIAGGEWEATPSACPYPNFLWSCTGYGTSIDDPNTTWNTPFITNGNPGVSSRTVFKCSSSKPNTPPGSLMDPGDGWDSSQDNCNDILWQTTGTSTNPANALGVTWTEPAKVYPDSVFTAYRCNPFDAVVSPPTGAYEDLPLTSPTGWAQTPNTSCTYPSIIWVSYGKGSDDSDDTMVWDNAFPATGEDGTSTRTFFACYNGVPPFNSSQATLNNPNMGISPDIWFHSINNCNEKLWKVVGTAKDPDAVASWIGPERLNPDSVFTLYICHDFNTKPAKPTNAYNTYPDDGTDTAWGKNPPDVCDFPSIIWIAYGAAENGDDTTIIWDEPTRLTGAEGKSYYTRTYFKQYASPPAAPTGSLNNPGTGWLTSISNATLPIWRCTGHSDDPNKTPAEWGDVARNGADSIYTAYYYSSVGAPSARPDGAYNSLTSSPTEREWCKQPPTPLPANNFLWYSYGQGDHVEDMSTRWDVPISAFEGRVFFKCTSTKPTDTPVNMVSPQNGWASLITDCTSRLWKIHGSGDPISPVWGSVELATADSVYTLFICSQYGPSKPPNNTSFNQYASGLNGWYQTIQPCSSPNRTFVSYGNANGPDHKIIWGAPVMLQGEDGEPGLTPVMKQYANLACYKIGSDLPPAVPSGGSYDFGNGNWSAPSGWSKTVINPSGSEVLWVATYAVVDVEGKSGTITLQSWAGPSKSYAYLDWDEIAGRPGWIDDNPPNWNELSSQANPLFIGELHTGGTPNPTGSGLYLSRDKLGYWYQDRTRWSAYLDHDGYFRLGEKGSSNYYGLYYNPDGAQLSVRTMYIYDNCYIKNALFVGTSGDGVAIDGNSATNLTKYSVRSTTKDISKTGFGWLCTSKGTAYFNSFCGFGPQTYMEAFHYTDGNYSPRETYPYGICGVCNGYSVGAGGAGADCIVSYDSTWQDWHNWFGYVAWCTNSTLYETEVNPDFNNLDTTERVLRTENPYPVILEPVGTNWEIQLSCYNASSGIEAHNSITGHSITLGTNSNTDWIAIGSGNAYMHFNPGGSSIQIGNSSNVTTIGHSESGLYVGAWAGLAWNSTKSLYIGHVNQGIRITSSSIKLGQNSTDVTLGSSGYRQTGGTITLRGGYAYGLQLNGSSVRLATYLQDVLIGKNGYKQYGESVQLGNTTYGLQLNNYNEQKSMVFGKRSGGYYSFVVNYWTDSNDTAVTLACGAGYFSCDNGTPQVGFFGHQPVPRQKARNVFELIDALRAYGLIE